MTDDQHFWHTAAEAALGAMGAMLGIFVRRSLAQADERSRRIDEHLESTDALVSEHGNAIGVLRERSAGFSAALERIEGKLDRLIERQS